MSLLLGDPRAPRVVRLRARTGVDFYGEPVLSWDDPERLELAGAEIQDRTSTESTTGQRLVVVTGKVLFVPGRPDLRFEDRVEVDGEVVYEVDGDPYVRRGLAIPVYTIAPIRAFERGGRH